MYFRRHRGRELTQIKNCEKQRLLMLIIFHIFSLKGEGQNMTSLGDFNFEESYLLANHRLCN